MPTDRNFPTPAEPVTDPTSCPCGHGAAAHDRVAARYCRATASEGLARGCVCTPLPETASALR